MVNLSQRFWWEFHTFHLFTWPLYLSVPLYGSLPYVPRIPPRTNGESDSGRGDGVSNGNPSGQYEWDSSNQQREPADRRRPDKHQPPVKGNGHPGSTDQWQSGQSRWQSSGQSATQYERGSVSQNGHGDSGPMGTKSEGVAQPMGRPWGSRARPADRDPKTPAVMLGYLVPADEDTGHVDVGNMDQDALSGQQAIFFILDHQNQNQNPPSDRDTEQMGNSYGTGQGVANGQDDGVGWGQGPVDMGPGTESGEEGETDMGQQGTGGADTSNGGPPPQTAGKIFTGRDGGARLEVAGLTMPIKKGELDNSAQKKVSWLTTPQTKVGWLTMPQKKVGWLTTPQKKVGWLTTPQKKVGWLTMPQTLRRRKRSWLLDTYMM